MTEPDELAQAALCYQYFAGDPQHPVPRAGRMGSIAAQLNERGIRMPRGGSWHVSSVANVLARANGCDQLR